MLIRKLAADSYQLISDQGTKQGALSDLAFDLEDKELTLILPASFCTHRELIYEAHERKLLEKILPWTLEEGLIDRVDELHFVINTIPQELASTQNTAAVCLVDKSLLARELEQFSRLGLNLTSCIPELCLLPWQPGQWTIILSENDECLVKFSCNEGLACNLPTLEFVLQLRARENFLPGNIVVYQSSQKVTLPLSEWLPGLAENKTQYVTQEAWQLFSHSCSEANKEYFRLELLSGEFLPRLPWSSWWKQWRITAVLLLGVGLLDLSARIIEANRLEQLNEALTTQVESVYREIIPDGVMVDPGLQLQRRLSALQGNSDSGFVALLNSAAPVIMNNPELEVQNLNFSEQENTLQVTLITNDFNTAESIRARLQSLGLQAELTGSTSSAEGSRSNLNISRQSTGRGVSG